MLELHTYHGDVAIGHLLSRDASELVKEGQELRIHAEGALPFVATLTEYRPSLPVGVHVDMVELRIDADDVRIFHTSEIHSITVLPTRRLTAALALRQMRQMERAAGLVPA